MMYKMFFRLFLLLSISSSALADMREWTGANGAKIQAEYVSTSGNQVTLKLKGGKIVTFGMDKLSPEDLAYVKAASKVSAENQRFGATLDVKSNFSAKWPSSSTPDERTPPKLVSEEDGEYVYETAHFRFHSNAKLSVDVIRSVGRLFEGTYSANQDIPFNNPCRYHGEGQKKYDAYLYETKEQYIEAGGPPPSAGVFQGGGPHGAMGRILVPFDSLALVKKGANYVVAGKRDYGTLIHEITHQMSIGSYQYPGWFVEGLAEYVSISSSPSFNGTFGFASNKSALLERCIELPKRPGPAKGRFLGKTPKVGPLETFMKKAYQESFMHPDDNVKQLYYGFSPMLLYYFAHVDGKGDAARIKKFVKAIQDGEGEEKAYEYLLDGRTWDKLQKDVTAGMKRMGGVTPDFS